MVDHQRGAHTGGLGDAAQADLEPVLTELLDRGVANAGGGRQVID